MATENQIQANRENAQHSTGPSSEAGKAASSKNATRHGLAGHAFVLLEWEHAEDFDRLQQSLRDEHQPTTPTEQILVEKMAQHYWLSQRAQSLQTIVMMDRPFDEEVQKELAPYVRYHAHFERLFQRALKDLLTLRAEKRKAEIGFVSQQAREAKELRSQAQETRRENNEKRRQEQHDKVVRLQSARIEHQQLRNRKLQCEVIEAEQAHAPQHREISEAAALLAA